MILFLSGILVGGLLAVIGMAALAMSRKGDL